ncbi:hypothetical protein HDU67_005961 [Dinochytrium kinnereticum]|nr:hypothetical protein HDU67_005961 [Dinochytrium kinnereticum]
MAAITLGPDLVIHEEVTLGSDHSLLVFTLNIPTDCFKAPFSRINVRNLMKRGQGAYRTALEEREGVVNGRLTELLQQAVINQASEVPKTWKERGHLVNSASTMITEWILDAAEQSGGCLQFKWGVTREKVDTPHLTALKAYALTARRNFLTADPDDKAFISILQRVAATAPRAFDDTPTRSCQNSRRNRSHCALDPTTLPEYAGHFATTFGHLGRVAYHQPCANCAEAVRCSRVHAVACSSADGILFGQFPLAADPDEGLGETLLGTGIASLHFEPGATRDSVSRRQIRLCVEAVERIRWLCAGQQPLWDTCDNGLDVELTQMFAEACQARPISARTRRLVRTIMEETYVEPGPGPL